MPVAAGFVFLAALLSATGAALFGVLFRPSRRVLSASLDIALIAAPVLLLVQARNIAGAVWLAPMVLRVTLFGRVLALQWIAVALARGLVARGGWPALLACLAATGLQCLHLHGYAMEGRFGPLTASDLLHLLAGAAWLGGLLPFALALRGMAVAQAAALTRRFSRLAMGCVAVLAVTAAYQGTVMVGSARALAVTDYGWTALGKLALFAVLLGFALRNRFVLLPALGGGGAAGTRALVRSVLTEAAVGLLLVLLAALLASLPPSMVMDEAG